LLGAPADELLAGLEGGLRSRADLPAGRRDARPRRRGRRSRRGADHPGVARGDGGRGGAHARAVSHRTPVVRRGGRTPEARAARDLAGRHAGAVAHRTGGFRRGGAAAVAWRRRRSVAGLEARDMGGAALAMASRDTSFYYSFLVLPSRKRQAIVA